MKYHKLFIYLNSTKFYSDLKQNGGYDILNNYLSMKSIINSNPLESNEI